MTETNNLIIKYLKRKNWVYDGTTYVFRDLSFDDISTLRCEVDCILPEKGQTYTRLKFNLDLQHEILVNVVDMFGETISFYVEFYVDGQVAKDVFLSNKTKVDVRNELKKLHYFKIGEEFSCELKLFPNFNQKPNIDSYSVDFPCFWDISFLHYKGNPVEVKDEYFSEAKGFIENYMFDHDFLPDVGDAYYYATEPYFILKDYDAYVSANGYLRNIDGKNLGEGKWDSNYTIKNIGKFFKKIKKPSSISY